MKRVISPDTMDTLCRSSAQKEEARQNNNTRKESFWTKTKRFIKKAVTHIITAIEVVGIVVKGIKLFKGLFSKSAMSFA